MRSQNFNYVIKLVQKYESWLEGWLNGLVTNTHIEQLITESKSNSRKSETSSGLNANDAHTYK